MPKNAYFWKKCKNRSASVSALSERCQRKMSGRNKTKKIETYGYNFRDLWHTKCNIIFLRRKPVVHSHYTIITRKEDRLAGSERIGTCVLWADAEKRIHNVGWLMWGSGGWAPSRRRQGGLEEEPQLLTIFQLFNKNNTFLGLINLNFCLKIFS